MKKASSMNKDQSILSNSRFSCVFVVVFLISRIWWLYFGIYDLFMVHEKIEEKMLLIKNM